MRVIHKVLNRHGQEVDIKLYQGGDKIAALANVLNAVSVSDVEWYKTISVTIEF